ncbi:MAG: rhamnulokinase [Firmicutes bacterium]|nr:rhamnulokinase [Bacillota bacterium]
MKYYLAVDIGASSGRHIIGYLKDGKIITEEVYRFKNGFINKEDHLIWDMEHILHEVIEGIKEAFKRYPVIESMSIDTWGVDYVLMHDNEEIWPCFGYRDYRMDDDIDEVHKIIPFEELYARTGCQFQKFNTIYQLYDDKVHGRLEKANDFLMIPEYLIYKLTGVKTREYTNASTSGLISLDTGEYDLEIIERLNLPKGLFPKLNQPKMSVGCLVDEIAKEVNGNLNVVLCATHDTGSAVEGIEMENDELYLSSGTWSLLGVKLKEGIADHNSMLNNYTNEGGIGYIRYQKNIMGMWIINELKKELCPDVSFEKIVKMAEMSQYDDIIDVNLPVFLSPLSMKKAFDDVLEDHLEVGDYFRCAYRSLGRCYAKAIEEIEHNTKHKYHKLYIVGGGAKNQYLNMLTEEMSGKKVIALPIEASAIGNIKVQMEVNHEL